MSVTVLYDDRLPVPADVQGLMGVRRYSRILYRKATLLAHLRELLRRAGIDAFLTLDDDPQAARLLEQGALSRRCLYIPSCLVARDPPRAVTFLQKLQHATRNLVLPLDPAGTAPPLLVLEPALLRELLAADPVQAWRAFRGRHEPELHPLTNDGGFVSLADAAALMEFLTSGFDVRYFNTISHDRFFVRKTSVDVAKLRREFQRHRFHQGAEQSFFLVPFCYEESEGQASYLMERLLVPDLAMQWIQNALDPAEFERLLDRLCNYLSLRETRQVPPLESERIVRALYLDKVAERLAVLHQTEGFNRLDVLVSRCTPYASLDHLFERYRGLFERTSARRRCPAVAASHGDLCFSNILYDKRTQLLKLIDPRGAASRDEVFLDVYYDVAKLSHSILGGYDFLNQNQYEVLLAQDLEMHLDVWAPDQEQQQAAFVRRMQELGFDPVLFRTYEASLFLSMLPLHMDLPKKTLAFILKAVGVMESVAALEGCWSRGAAA